MSHLLISTSEVEFASKFFMIYMDWSAHTLECKDGSPDGIDATKLNSCTQRIDHGNMNLLSSFNIAVTNLSNCFLPLFTAYN